MFGILRVVSTVPKNISDKVLCQHSEMLYELTVVTVKLLLLRHKPKGVLVVALINYMLMISKNGKRAFLFIFLTSMTIFVDMTLP